VVVVEYMVAQTSDGARGAYNGITAITASIRAARAATYIGTVVTSDVVEVSCLFIQSENQ